MTAPGVLAGTRSLPAFARGMRMRTGSRESRLVALRVLGALAVGIGAYSAYTEPRTSPGGEAGLILGTATIVAFVTVGVNMQAAELRARMGRQLVYAGAIFSVVLLASSNGRLEFSVGWLGLALLPPLIAYLLLAYPSGRLHSAVEQRLLLAAGIPLVLSWLAVVLSSRQPAFATPLLRCRAQCPPNALDLFPGEGDTALWDLVRASWLVLAWGVVACLWRRTRSASAPVGLSLAPLTLLSLIYALATTGALLEGSTTSSLAESFSSASLAVGPAIPLVMLLGITRESLFMGSSLSAFVKRLGEDPAPDLQLLMAETLHDPSLRILYRRPGLEAYVDSSGRASEPPEPTETVGLTPIERDSTQVAVVAHDVELSDQKRFIEAAGAAGAIRFRNAQLAADLRASVADLAESRARIVETADAERQRIEHSLHDGAQQHLVGMRLRLEQAAELVRQDPESGMRLLSDIGRQMDEALEDVRNLAKGVYPPLLPEHGLAEAISSVNRRSPWPASLDAGGIGRYPADTEAAVYFCCLEAIQNITKHAGPAVGGAIRLWDDGDRLHFEVSDEGLGFSQDAFVPGQGLMNMRDRMEAAGGILGVNSRPGRGTVVRGSVPIAGRGQAPRVTR